MQIVINGKERRLASEQSLTLLLSELQVPERWVAVAINGSFVPKGQYSQQQIKAGDHIEILEPAQGG